MKIAADILKSLKPSIMARAVVTFDRMTLWIVGCCWIAAILLIVFALYTINLSITAERQAEAALATEPVLPVIKHGGIDVKELQVMIERLKQHYPDIIFGWQNSVLSVVGRDASHYHEWLTAIGQIDTLNPHFHWTIRSMCIGGTCNNQALMTVELVCDKIAFQMPQPAEKK